MAQIEYFTAAFVEAASVPLNAWHASGTLDHANEILGANPGIATADIYTAAILGDEASVRRFVEADPESATRPGGSRNWNALTYLCFSRYLKLDSSKSDGFVRAAKLLLDVGASANSGWFENEHQPKPEWESVLYGAAGIAHHPGLTRLLLERGADPNDGETLYHTPETFDNRALKLLVETGKLTPESLALMLVRKHDWHDLQGVKWLLDQGADPNFKRDNGRTPLFHGVLRDNDIEIIEASLDHGGNPALPETGPTCIELAAYRGRKDLLDLFEKRGFSVQLEGLPGLIAACARHDENAVQSILEQNPELVEKLKEEGGRLLSLFAGTGNLGGVRMLLDLGVPVDALFDQGDGYYGIAENSTALHVAAWRMHPDIVRLLVERGADVNAKDARNRTPLMLAVSACVDSYWTERRTPESVDVLLKAGASVQPVEWPSGYEEVDALLAEYGKRG